MPAPLTDQRTDLQQQTEALRARRPSLAFAAAQGDMQAGTELGALDATLQGIAYRLDILDLAEREAARIAELEAQARGAEERRRLVAAIATAEAQQIAAYRRVEAALAELLSHAQAAVTAGDNVDRLSGQLGTRGASAAGHAARQGIAERIANKYWVTIGPGYLPAHGSDRPLAEGDPS